MCFLRKIHLRSHKLATETDASLPLAATLRAAPIQSPPPGGLWLERRSKASGRLVSPTEPSKLCARPPPLGHAIQSKLIFQRIYERVLPPLRLNIYRRRCSPGQLVPSQSAMFACDANVSRVTSAISELQRVAASGGGVRVPVPGISYSTRPSPSGYPELLLPFSSVFLLASFRCR